MNSSFLASTAALVPSMATHLLDRARFTEFLIGFIAEADEVLPLEAEHTSFSQPLTFENNLNHFDEQWINEILAGIQSMLGQRLRITFEYSDSYTNLRTIFVNLILNDDDDCVVELPVAEVQQFLQAFFERIVRGQEQLIN